MKRNRVKTFFIVPNFKSVDHAPYKTFLHKIVPLTVMGKIQKGAELVWGQNSKICTSNFSPLPPSLCVQNSIGHRAALFFQNPVSRSGSDKYRHRKTTQTK